MEIIFHGLGGQGAKSAAQILAEAASEEGKEIHTYPEFGPERKGAPVKAFVRISDKKIITHQPITEPDATVIIDPSLADKKHVTCLTGKLIVNTTQSVEEIKEKTGFKGETYVIDVSSLGFPNLPMLAALLKVEPVVKFDTIIKKAEQMFTKKYGKERADSIIEGMKKAYEMIK